MTNPADKILSRPALELDEIYASYFQGREKERFVFLWKSLSKIVSIPAGKIRPDDAIVDLFAQSNWSPVSIEMDNLTEFVARQSQGRKAHTDMKTVGKVILFLLE